MSWHEDLRSLDWQGRKYAVLDTINEEGRIYLGLTLFDEVAGIAAALDAGRPRPLPSNLTWVEAAGSGFIPLPRKAVARVLKLKSDRALAAFQKR